MHILFIVCIERIRFDCILHKLFEKIQIYVMLIFA